MNTPQDILLNNGTLKEAVSILRAINHPLRQNMIRLLEDRNGMKVTEIFINLRLEQSVASQHLGILRRAGIVSTNRDGKFILYHLNRGRIAEIVNFITELTGEEVEA